MTQERDQAIARATGLAYAAIDAPAQWDALAAELAQLVDAEGAVIHIDFAPGVAPQGGSTNPAFRAAYQRDWQLADPFLDPSLVRHMSQARRAFLSHELIDDRDLRASTLYQDFLQPNGNVFHGVGGNFSDAHYELLQFWAWRGKAMGCFDERDRELANAVLTHVERAATLAARLARLQARAHQHDAVQDSLLDAVLVLDASDRLVHCNARAGELLNGSAADGAFAARALRLAGMAEQQRLGLALRQARDAPDRPPHALRLLRQKPLPPLYAVVAPSPTGQDGQVQIFLRDPRWQKFMPEEELVALYDLTPAQARVCAALVHGESAEDIAQRLGVQLATVRSQLKGAMEKVGMHRQSDLVRHLSLALPALLHIARAD